MTLQGICFLEDMEIENKCVFMRLDLNVPLKKGVIQDETRIQGALPSIRYALEHNARLIAASHLGRPKLEDRQLSMEPLAKRLSEILDVEVILVEDLESETLQFILQTWKSGQIILLENLRFDPREMENNPEFTRILCRHVDIYINDAFGVSHRAHSSVVGIPTEIRESGIGFLMKKEIQSLDRLLYESKPPFGAVLGGAKVSDKVGVMDHLIDLVDVFLIGGAMAYTFLKAQGVSVGDSKVEREKINFVKRFLKRLQSRNKRCVLPIDHLVVSAQGTNQVREITQGCKGVDIGPQTIKLFQENMDLMKTIFWNGPMGVFEEPEFSKGTFSVAKAMEDNKEAFCVVGGGDSVAAVKASGCSGIDYISTGGGASLEYLQGVSLVGLEALRK